MRLFGICLLSFIIGWMIAEVLKPPKAQGRDLAFEPGIRAINKAIGIQNKPTSEPWIEIRKGKKFEGRSLVTNGQGVYGALEARCIEHNIEFYITIVDENAQPTIAVRKSPLPRSSDAPNRFIFGKQRQAQFITNAGDLYVTIPKEDITIDSITQQCRMD